MAKSPCPLSRTQFLEKAEAVKVSINGQEIIADKREFSTGSFGWSYHGKSDVTVDGKPLSVQVGLNLTVVGSKEAERGAGPTQGRVTARRCGRHRTRPKDRVSLGGGAQQGGEDCRRCAILKR